MQQLVEAVRAGLTATQVRYLIERAPSVRVGAGLEATDLAQDEVLDITADFVGGTVDRACYATLHGGAALQIARPLEWGWQVVRPYMTISDGLLAARFNLGAYFTNTPRRPTGESPPTYDVTCYDLLYRLDKTVGGGYSVAKGTPILARVEEILLGRGFTKYLIDQSRADAVTPDIKTWALDDAVSWLTIINDLLGMIGYQGIWTDWNGMLRCQPYQRPLDRSAEWYFGAEQYSILEPDAEVEFDYHDAFNRWVGIRQNNPEDAAPVEGNGIFTLENQSTGPTSIDARAGFSNTRQESFDVVGQADLISAVNQMADADMSVPTTVTVSTGPFPLAWHFDRHLLDNPEVGVPSEVLGTNWSLPLNGEPMAHTWTVLSGVQS
jgi:hypothetical protein